MLFRRIATRIALRASLLAQPGRPVWLEPVDAIVICGNINGVPGARTGRSRGCLAALLLLLARRAGDRLLPRTRWPVVLTSSRRLWRSKFALLEPQKLFLRAGKKPENLIVYNPVRKGWTHLAD